MEIATITAADAATEIMIFKGLLGVWVVLIAVVIVASIYYILRWR